MRTAAHMVRTVPGVSTLCKDELPAGLVVRGHGPPGGSRPTSRSVTQRTDCRTPPSRWEMRSPAPSNRAVRDKRRPLAQTSREQFTPSWTSEVPVRTTNKTTNRTNVSRPTPNRGSGYLNSSRQRDSSAQTVARSRFGGIPGTRRHASVRVPADSSQLALRPPRVFTGFDGQRRWHERVRVAVECRCQPLRSLQSDRRIPLRLRRLGMVLFLDRPEGERGSAFVLRDVDGRALNPPH